MSTNQMVITKTETKTAITTEQSQKLMQTMLTMSFGCLTFLRGLFPDENFIDQRFVPAKSEKNYNKNLISHSNSIKIKTLIRGKNNDVNTLLDWLEKGVFPTIKLNFLKSLSFGIYLNENDPTNLCENYIFNFDYLNNNNKNEVSLTLNNQNNESTISLFDSRKMAQQLMRRFIIITQSLEPLPQKKYLSMRLLFNDNVKTDYQPDFFKDASFDKRATLKIPLDTSLSTFSAGSLSTNHHHLKMNVYSTINENNITNNNNDKYMIIDPFEIEAERDSDVLEQKLNTHSQSQTSNILGNFLNSDKTNLQETQMVIKDTQPMITTEHINKITTCDCNLACQTNATAMKKCKMCNKQIHGICYGNINSASIQRCFKCLLDCSFDQSSSEFQDLMIVRKCFRYLARCKKMPTSVNSIINDLVADKTLLNQELKERFAFSFSLFLFDEVIILDEEENHEHASQSNKYRSTVMTFDLPNIKSPFTKFIDPNKQYPIKIYLNINSAHNCYSEILPNSKEQANQWIQEIIQLKENIIDGLPDSCDITKLVVQDTESQDSIRVRQKRNHLDLDDYLQDDQSSIMRDTLQSPVVQPKKIQKISISKNTLRSEW
ncbi:DNA binding protein [Maudiozyma exigua]|uniref:DNA binding protein n=1 Tax=Maudiozyma exigua TaxID=34358 RepID=A0A9P6WFE8_MAUEX|nr:DNA binding protein [Kazachstania exigua]